VAIRNELAYPITVFSVEPGGLGLAGTPAASMMASCSDVVHVTPPADTKGTIRIQPGQTGQVTFGGRMIHENGRDVIGLYITPAADASGVTPALAAWTNCAIGLSPPSAPTGVTLVIRRSTETSTLAVDAFDQMGRPVDGVMVGWNVVGLP
jgi:hypothetical protein